MYDVRGKSVGGGHKGRMQQAVDDWERSANAAVESDNKPDGNEIGEEVKNAIKNNIKEINAVKSKADVKRNGAANSGDEAEPSLMSDTERQYASNFAQAKSKKFSKQAAPQSKEVFSGGKDINTAIDGDDAPLDYEAQDQAEEILGDQDSFKHSLLLKFAGCIICAAFLAWFAVAPELNIQLPPYINVNSHPSYYISANLILLLIAGIIGFPVAFKGIASLFTFQPDADSLTLLSFYAALIGGIYTLYNYAVVEIPPSGLPATAVFSSCAAACISFNLLGKMFLVARVKNNLQFISEPENAGGGFYCAAPVEPRKAQDIMRTFQGTPAIATVKKISFMTNYLEQSYIETPSDRVSRFLAPIALVAALLSAIGDIIIKKDVAGAVTVFTVVCCVASPILLEMGVSVPFYRLCKRLVKEQTLVTGCDTLSRFSGTDAVVAEGSLIFPESAIRIFGIKTFLHYKIDEAVLYASSIAYAGKSPLSGAFMGMFADGCGKNLLKPAEKLVYEDEKGLSAIIDNKVVLLGNREILRHHLIEAPSRDYELRNAADGRDVVYLAIDGAICAMFIVEYSLDTSSSASFRKLRHYGISLLIDSSDPNITPLLLEEKCDVPATNAVVLGAREMQILDRDKDDGRCTAGLSFKDLSGYIAGVVSCIKLNGTLRANTALQAVFSAVGMLLVIYCAFFAGGISAVSPLYVLVYQALCAVPVLIISLFRRS